MADKFGCKYSVARFYPNLASDEFLNVGIIMHCDPKTSGQIEARFLDRYGQLKLFVPKQSHYILGGLKLTLRDLDRMLELKSEDEHYLNQFVNGFQHCLRFSEIRATLTDDPVQEVEKLYDLYVTIDSRERATRGQITKKQIKKLFRQAFKHFQIDENVEEDVPVAGRYLTTQFDFKYSNHEPHLLQSISLDLQNTELAIDQIKALRGGAEDVKERDKSIHIVAALYPSEKDVDLFNNAKSFLKQAGCDVRDLRQESEENIVGELKKSH